MVHGNYYGAQYEIYIYQPIDFYNDILPISMLVREKFELIEFGIEQRKIKRVNFSNGISKLIIIPYINLDKRFEKLKYVGNYVSSIDKLSNIGLNIFSKTRKDNFEDFKYFDVMMYKNLIKHNKSLPTPITSKELESLEESYQNELDRDCEITASLLNELNIQRIISNPKYFEEIKNIEKSLTNIELTDREKTLINKVINHPNIKDLIEFHGINLIEGNY